MYLMAFSPSVEFLSSFVYYESQLRSIQKTDYTKEIKQNPEMLAVTAKAQGITVDDYKKKLAEEMKKEAVRKLKERYNIREEKDENKTDEQLEAESIVNHYRDKMRAMKDNPKINTMVNPNAIDDINELFDGEI